MVRRVSRGFFLPGRVLLTAGLVGLLLMVGGWVGSVAASANAPWWHLTGNTRPTYLRSGIATNEVQLLTVHGSGGSFSVERLQSHEHENVVGSPVVVPFNASAVELQGALETLYPPGSVNVTKGSGSAPYVITFVGGLADQAVLPLKVSGEALLGSGSSASLVESVHGRPDGELVLNAENLGDASINGGEAPSPVKLIDVVPPGVEVVAVSASEPEPGSLNKRLQFECALQAGTPTCEIPGVLYPYQDVEMRVGVVVKPGASSTESNEGRISGGEAAAASVRRPLMISDEPVPFGPESYELLNEEEGGALASQAGEHPFQLTTAFTLNQGASTEAMNDRPDSQAVGLAKDVNFKWPPGLIGNPQAIPHCTLGKFLTSVEARLYDGCGPEAAVGVAAVTVYEPNLFQRLRVIVPLFNLEPARGEPARFGFYVSVAGVPVVIDTSLRTGGDYGVTVSSHDISQTASILSTNVTVWGVPGDSRHDSSRGWGCLLTEQGFVNGVTVPPCDPQNVVHPPPFLSLPTSCSGQPLQSTVEAASWAQPEVFRSLTATLPVLDGCNQLPFSSSISVAPDGQAASTPTGLNVDVHVPQDSILNGTGLADSNVKNIMVTFPEGVVLNPAAADGLQACSEGQIGFLAGESTSSEDLHFTSGLPAPAAPAEPFCPEASKIGKVTITTPLLPNKLEGALYLASQNANPFGSLIAVYLVAEDPVSGSLVKLPGEVSLDPSTGRITTTFKNNPQVAFEDAEIHLFGGERAPLATPDACGTYTTEATFTPWSGNAPVKSQSSFNITSGPNGSPCPSTLPFNPSLTGGTTNINAAAFSPLTTTISREDGNQKIRTVQLHMPPGLSGILTGVKLCPEAQANAGTCSPESLIGRTTVSVGLGGDPFSVTGGQVFLTEKYEGAPFGLSIVNPAIAGPFDLGKVVVRAKIEVDPHTAELTVTTDEIPHILDGIPLQIKHVNVTIDRPGFIFNSTNCNPMMITGNIGSVEGASSPVSVPFQVTNCASLKFAPKFSVSTSGNTSRAKGASLTAKLYYPNAPQGTQTNISRVKVDLPKQLPSRLTTLQKACTNKQFEANPANCPAASKIGQAKVTTPLLPVPLTGPAIFVSHGGEAFPSLTMVLQGYGITVDLVGTTFISKKGITSTTFKTVPDVPFNTFQLTLPQGKYSALAANGNLCKTKLGMPTAFQAQNGQTIHQTTTIHTTQCHKQHTNKKHKPQHHKQTHTNKH